MDLHNHHHHHHHHANININPTLNPNLNPNPNPNPSPNRSEAERLLGIAEKLLQTRDLTGSREFALLAQETEPLLEGSDQILAITDVLLASETRVVNNRHHDWYAILQTNPHSLSSDPDLLKKNYRRLALLLHPDKNRYPLADSAFKLVADAWALLSDPSKKGLYDHELNVYSKVELRPGPHQHTTPPSHPGNTEKDKLPVRRSPRAGVGGGLDSSSDPPPTAPSPHTAPRHNNTNSYRKQQQRGSGAGASRMSNFWTACPYCYVLYEYPRAYEECCLRCQNCERAFHATVINSLPPMVPGKEAYYCCWGFFPLGFSLENSGGTTNKGKKKVDANTNTNVDLGGNDNNNNAPNHNNNNDNNNNNAGQNLNSGFPNWMPAGMFGTPAAPAQGGGGVPNTNMNMNMNPSVGGVDISDGSASAGFVFNNNNNNNNNVSTGFGNVAQGLGNSAPSKKRGRPRKNPFPV